MQRYRGTVAAHWEALAALFVGLLAPLSLFGLLAEDVWAREGFGWDTFLLNAVHAHATARLDTFMLLITRIGAPLPMLAVVALSLLALLLRGRRTDLLFVAVAVGGAAALNLLAKLLFQRARPALWPSLTPETDYSFPSGHAMGSLAVVAALSVLLWHTRWRWAVLAAGLLFVLAVGLSRIYLGVHFPSDILAGWSASLAWVTGVQLLRFAPWWPRWHVLAPLPFALGGGREQDTSPGQHSRGAWRVR